VTQIRSSRSSEILLRFVLAFAKVMALLNGMEKLDIVFLLYFSLNIL
jgi:hypothetical protein